MNDPERQAFCEIDPERHYAVSKDQFANAIATACSVVAATKLLDFNGFYHFTSSTAQGGGGSFRIGNL